MAGIVLKVFIRVTFFNSLLSPLFFILLHICFSPPSIKSKVKVKVAPRSPTLCDPLSVAARLLSPWNSPGRNTGVGSHSLLQEIFLTQLLNPGLLHCRKILYHLSNFCGFIQSLVKYPYF